MTASTVDTDPAFSKILDGVVQLAAEPGVEPEAAEARLTELRQAFVGLTQRWAPEPLAESFGRALARRWALIDVDTEYADAGREALWLGAAMEGWHPFAGSLLRAQVVRLTDHLLSPGVLSVYRLLLGRLRRFAQEGDEESGLWLKQLLSVLPD